MGDWSDEDYDVIRMRAAELATPIRGRSTGSMQATIDAQAERIAALEAAVRAAWDATQSITMSYEDAVLVVEAALSPVLPDDR